MGATNNDGPNFQYGSMGALTAALASPAGPVPDPNQDAGPNGVYQGVSFLDPRFFFQKDKVQGYTGVVPAHFMLPVVRSVGQIPAALASNNIAAAQNVVNGTAMTLAVASVGVDVNIPIFPFSAGNINGPGANVSATTAAIMLDFGFAFGSCVAASANVTVANASVFTVGQPLVIAGVGNSAGTAPLLTNVASVNTTTNVITLVSNALPLATNAAAAIGAGNIWQPSEAIYLPGQGVPTAHLPYLAAGPSLLLDPRQALARGVRIVGASGGAGGTFTVRGWDVYWQPMTQTVTVAAGASTGWSTKCFKALASVTPNFTDAHNYTVGTSDVFGLNYREGVFDDLSGLTVWAGTTMPSSTGFTAFDATSPATATTGDVRGTVQTGSGGGGTGISGGAASNGSVVSLAMSGNRLTIASMITMFNATNASPANAVSVFGVTQA